MPFLLQKHRDFNKSIPLYLLIIRELYFLRVGVVYAAKGHCDNKTNLIQQSYQRRSGICCQRALRQIDEFTIKVDSFGRSGICCQRALRLYDPNTSTDILKVGVVYAAKGHCDTVPSIVVTLKLGRSGICCQRALRLNNLPISVFSY